MKTITKRSHEKMSVRFGCLNFESETAFNVISLGVGKYVDIGRPTDRHRSKQLEMRAEIDLLI